MNLPVTAPVSAPPPVNPPEPARPLLDPQAITTALAGIRADSQREPDTYLRDTVVPHGGE